jgi:hypothetical protein
MTIADKGVLNVGHDWLGRPQLLSIPRAWTQAYRLGQQGKAQDEITRVRPIRTLVTGRGDRPAKLKSEIRLGWTQDAFWIHATLYTARLDRVAKLAGEPQAYRRDRWGADALEVQIDMGRTHVRYAHLILTPGAEVVSYEGFSNRHVDGYHPKVDLKVRLDSSAGAWVLVCRVGFDALGEVPRVGAVWGLNILRVDADEEGGYSQWAPTYGEALRPSLFGGLKFLGSEEGGDCDARLDDAEVAAYGEYWRIKREAFQRRINGIGEADALGQLRVGENQGGPKDWKAWGAHVARRAHPGPVRWDAWEAGKVPECDRATVMALAAKAMENVQGWDVSAPTVAYLDVFQAESIADALMLTGEDCYAKALEKVILAHDACWRAILEKPGMPVGHEHPRLYPDSQVTQAVFLGHLYFALVRHGEVSERVHAAVMLRMLRAGRFADQNISLVYFYGNHQAHESAGLGTIASLFPEFAESDRWAQTASLAMRMHYLGDVYGDGGYMERCGYHTVALSFTAQTIAAIKSSGQESRFAPLMCAEVLEVIDRMYDWVVKMMLPDGTLPMFGDYRKHSQARLLLQGAMLRGRRDWLWPVKRAVPELLEGVDVGGLRNEGVSSVSMDESGFTVMRSAVGGHAMAVDHGPLGGQHSHVDTMGFVAYLKGRAVAVDSGMGLSYSDPNYLAWYRNAEAHNVVTVDDAVPEKVAWRTGWHGGKQGDILVIRSDAWRHSRGVAWERAILFSHLGVWVIFDRLRRVDDRGAKPKFYDLHLHCPTGLETGAEDCVRGDGVMFKVTGCGGAMKPSIQLRPGASARGETLAMRLHDALSLHGDAVVSEVSHATWRVAADKDGGAWFTTVITPGGPERVMALGQRNAVIQMDQERLIFTRDGGGWSVSTERKAGVREVERLEAILAKFS